jgi:hypothetical protein
MLHEVMRTSAVPIPESDKLTISILRIPTMMSFPKISARRDNPLNSKGGDSSR